MSKFSKVLENLKEQLDGYVELYSNTSEGEKPHLMQKIKSKLQEYTYFYCISVYYQDDDAIGFSNYIVERLDETLKKYNKDKGNFTRFIARYLKTGYKYYKKTTQNYQDNSQITIGDAEEFFFNTEEKEEYEKIEKDYSKITLTPVDKVKILCFVLSMARECDEQIQKNIAKMIGTSFKEVNNYIISAIELDEELFGKNEKIQKLLELRDFCNTRIIKSNAAPIIDTEERKVAELKKKELQTRAKIYEEKIQKLKMVSHKAIAETLNVDYKLIRSYIHRAKVLLESIESQI